jgi:DNA modification methylase
MCSAWRGELGRELRVEDYISHLTLLFREVKRVLHAQGTLWVNLGDCYAGATDGPVPPGYKAKDLIPVSWLLGQALREDGWWLRSQIIWHKPNVKPNSYRDRPVSDYEPVLMLSKQEHYYYDYLEGLEDGMGGGQRNLRTVWSINTEGSGYKHYACYPRELPLRCIRLGTPGVVCPRCGTPHRREVATTRGATNEREAVLQRVRTAGAISGGRTGVTLGKTREISRTDGGFVKTCTCDTDETLPGIVLDPFGGLMRTGEAALELGRRFIGLELSPEYAEEGKRRLAALS